MVVPDISDAGEDFEVHSPCEDHLCTPIGNHSEVPLGVEVLDVQIDNSGNVRSSDNGGDESEGSNQPSPPMVQSANFRMIEFVDNPYWQSYLLWRKEHSILVEGGTSGVDKQNGGEALLEGTTGKRKRIENDEDLNGIGTKRLKKKAKKNCSSGWQLENYFSRASTR